MHHDHTNIPADAYWMHVTKSASILHDAYGKYNPTSVREACLHALRHKSIVRAYEKGGIELKVSNREQRGATISAVVEQCRIKLESTESYQKYAQKEMNQVIQITDQALQKDKGATKLYPQIKSQFVKDKQRWQEEQARQQQRTDSQLQPQDVVHVDDETGSQSSLTSQPDHSLTTTVDTI